MNDEELFKSLEQLGCVFSIDYNLLRKIFNIFPQSKLYSVYFPKYEIDINNYDNWITYDNCVDFKFQTEENNVFCTVMVYNGNFYYGDKEDLRFQLILKIPKSFLKNIKTIIKEELESYFSRKYRKMLQQMEIDWVNKEIENFLKN